MIANAVIVLGTLALMGVAAWHANSTLPSGPLPMGRTEKPNTNRIVVLLQSPLIYMAALVIIYSKNAFEGRWSASGTQSTSALAFISIVMLVAQQAQLWGVRRIMRKGPF